jgi:hypothetical protein
MSPRLRISWARRSAKSVILRAWASASAFRDWALELPSLSVALAMP